MHNRDKMDCFDVLASFNFSLDKIIKFLQSRQHQSKVMELFLFLCSDKKKSLK